MDLSQGRISLLFPDVYKESGNNFRFFRTPTRCQICDESMLKRILSDLKGVFDSETLEVLETRADCAQAQFMVAFWLWKIEADESSVEWMLGHDIKMECGAETQRLPQEIATTVLSYYAIFGMQPCLVRVDENNRSTCAGNRVIGAQFLVISYLVPETFRVWFRDPGTADATRFRNSEAPEVTMVFAFDLLASELSELSFRVHFTTPTDRPSLDIWPPFEKSTKALLWRAIYQKRNNHLGTLYDQVPQPVPVPINMHCQIPDK